MTDLRTFEPYAKPFHATAQVPGDKSLSHRALIFAAMASGESRIVNLGPGLDIAATGRALRAVGAQIEDGVVQSPGVERWREPRRPIDCGNSGTTLRLMAGALSGRPFTSVLSGDTSLELRPMDRLVAPLQALGASVLLADGGTAPVEVNAPTPLRGAYVEIEMASAQVRSAFTFAALQADGSSTVVSPAGFRDHTERWIEALGRGERLNRETLRILPGELPAGRFDIPGDPSSAAYLWAAAAIREGSEVTTPGVSLNPGRIGFLQVIEAMGATVEADVTASTGGDPVGDVTVRGGPLQGTEISGELTVSTLDELPLVALVAAYAEGITVVRDAAELRIKESDRIASTVAMIRALSGGAEATEDGFVVIGTGWLEAGTVDSNGDHRIAMAAAVAATRAHGPVALHRSGAAEVSWPGFYEALGSVCSSL